MCSKDLIVVVDKAKYLSTWGIDVIAYAQSKDKEEARYPVPLLITRKQEAATEEAAECLNLMKKLDPELIREMSEMESKKRKRKTFPCAGCGLLPVNHHWSKCENCKKTKTRRMK